MNDLLKRLKLLDNLKFELLISRTDFVNILSSNVDKPQADFFDIFSGSKNSYKGKVTYEGFELKRKKRFFDTNFNLAKANGKITQAGDRLVVDIEMNGFHFLMIPFMIFLLFVYGVFIVMFVSGDMKGTEAALMLPFMLLHAVFMLGIPYLLMRRSIRSTKYDIERDIYFMMKDKINTPQPQF